jgi:copper chaperone CopZ
MIKQYRISGMTCGGCVASVKQNLEEHPMVTRAEVTLDPPQATISMDMPVPITILESALGKKYSLLEAEAKMFEDGNIDNAQESLPQKTLTTYKPLLLIIGFIAGVSALSQYPSDSFQWMLFMRHFMAGFFIVFSFFKLLNLSGFASSYSMYDVVAAKWYGWGFIYPFVELGLGVLFLINAFPIYTNVATIIILGVSTIGVVQSNLQKRAIKCACLGDVFNLPMSTVTIVEDVGMILMSVAMLVLST